jgi:hypothetical protein
VLELTSQLNEERRLNAYLRPKRSRPWETWAFIFSCNEHWLKKLLIKVPLFGGLRKVKFQKSLKTFHTLHSIT